MFVLLKVLEISNLKIYDYNLWRINRHVHMSVNFLILSLPTYISLLFENLKEGHIYFYLSRHVSFVILYIATANEHLLGILAVVKLTSYF